MDDKLVKFGVAGLVLSTLCFFIPALFLLFGATGVSWALGRIDYIVMPALAFFIVLTIYAMIRRERSRDTY